MSGIWERTLVYLGLREEPDEHVEWGVLEAADVGDPAQVEPTVRPAQVRPVAPPPAPTGAQVADLRPVRSTPTERVTVVQLRVFDDVAAAGRNHREGRGVLLDVSEASAADGRRAVDFLSGVVYVSGGTLRRLTRGGFLLLPSGAELDAAERDRLTRLGYPVDAGGDR